MKCCLLRRWWGLPAGMFLAPSILWLGIVLVAPTQWARTKLEGAIADSTGRSVHLGRVSLCLLGGLSLSDLQIGAPGTFDDPWLRAGELTLDVSPLSILRGRMAPRRLDVNDATIRVLRRENGKFELADPVRTVRRGSGEFDESDCCSLGTCLEGAHRVEIGIHRAVVVILDQHNRTRHELREVEGEATLEGRSGGVVTLNGLLGNGSFQITCQLDRTMKEPIIDVQLESSGIDLSQDMEGLRYVMPVLAGNRGRLEGKLASRISLHARGSDTESLFKSLRGKGTVTLQPVRLEQSSFLDTLCKLTDQLPVSMTESIRTQFEIQNERISTDALTIQIGSIPVRFSGWTDFNGQLDYKMHLDAMAGRIPDKALQIMREFDLDVAKMAILQLSGNLDHLEVRVDETRLDPHAGQDRSSLRDERERIRMIGRKFVDRLIR